MRKPWIELLRDAMHQSGANARLRGTPPSDNQKAPEGFSMTRLVALMAALSISFAIFTAPAHASLFHKKNGFVTVKGTSLQLDGAPYRFIGTNFWYGMNLGSEGPGGDQARLIRELDRLKAIGVTNLRILGMSEGPDT